MKAGRAQVEHCGSELGGTHDLVVGGVTQAGAARWGLPETPAFPGIGLWARHFRCEWGAALPWWLVEILVALGLGAWGERTGDEWVLDQLFEIPAIQQTLIFHLSSVFHFLLMVVLDRDLQCLPGHWLSKPHSELQIHCFSVLFCREAPLSGQM